MGDLNEAPDPWPSNLTLKRVGEWFEVERHTVLIDTVVAGIVADGIG